MLACVGNKKGEISCDIVSQLDFPEELCYESLSNVLIVV